MTTAVYQAQLVFTVRHTMNSVEIALVGELDIAAQPDVTTAVHAVVGQRDDAIIRLDSTGITFIDSVGLRSLIIARYAALRHGHTFALEVTANGPVDRLVTIAGLVEYLGATRTPTTSQPPEARVNKP